MVLQSFIFCGLFSKAVRLNTILLIFYYLLTHCCCRSLVVVVVVSVPLSLLASRKCWRRLLLFLLSDSHCLCWRWRLVVISVSSMAAAVSLLMASFFDFVDFFSLLLSVLSRHCWRCVVIVGGGVPYLGCFCRLWRLVVEVGGGVSSTSLFCCCRQRCTLLWLNPSTFASRWRRHLVVFVGSNFTPIETNISFCS